jgi:hypothetical protein
VIGSSFKSQRKLLPRLIPMVQAELAETGKIVRVRNLCALT